MYSIGIALEVYVGPQKSMLALKKCILDNVQKEKSVTSYVYVVQFK